MNAPPHLNVRRLFLAGNLSILMIGLGFAVRATIASDLQNELFNKIDLANSAGMIGSALGITFTGFALTLLFGSALVDLIGIRWMLAISALGFLAGSVFVLAAWWVSIGVMTYPLILIGFLLMGIGWGAVEAGSNPMVAALYPDDKTHRLNVLHAWWPAGIVIGGLGGLALRGLQVPWQINLLFVVVPALILLYLVLSLEFPVTERVASGVSYGDMVRELRLQPMFFLWLFTMMLTAATELAPGQWVDLALSRVVGMRGILLLVYVSGLMFVMRHFAGALAHRLSSVGVLWISSALAAIGLIALSIASNPVTALLAATIWGVGVCYMWPTMVASVAERFPRGGALFMGLTGFAGGLSIQFVLPRLGAIFDRAKLEAAGGVEKFATLPPDQLNAVLRRASVESFQAVALIPLALIPIFGFIWLRDRARRKRRHETAEPALAFEKR